MSLKGFVTPTRAYGIFADQYDHAIDLVDTTKPAVEPSSSSLDLESATQSSARRNSDGTLNRRWTRGTLREELARRKYAKYQERDNQIEGLDDVADNGVQGDDKDSIKNGKGKKNSIREGRFRDRIPFRSKKPTKVRKQQDYEVDILYENQRGSFFCGIPLYSSKSLLNFDPSAWQTAAFKDSPVDITNAQVPDPTWAWAWKCWYVDMSHDVDEEGWEYSFSFRQGFSWHGNHPWFHSFVRRRRWLRKRVKAHLQGGSDSKSGPHMLNADYFTIHPARASSRASSADRSVDNRSSYISIQHAESGSEDEDGEISNILALMKALKKATVDRKKTEAMTNFLDHGGDDLYYLPDHMHEIMGIFLYQTSRQQLVTTMQDVLDRRTKRSQENGNDGTTEPEDKNRQTDSLLKALHAAKEHVNDLEYWSDVKHTRSGGVRGEEGTSDQHSNSSTSREADSSSISAKQHGEDDGSSTVDLEIKGIPEDAAIDKAPSINWDFHGDEQSSPVRSSWKGKEKAVD
ncbi:hypothetical protein MMC26_007194 [Xylographa opegraphella]|nr:hypothetical protein [Xylographa opegraphella]